MKKKVKFLTYQQQLDNLRDHGLIVTNDRIGTELLQSRGYYNLINRYKEDLYRKGQKEYPIQTTLEDLYKYHRIEVYQLHSMPYLPSLHIPPADCLPAIQEDKYTSLRHQ